MYFCYTCGRYVKNVTKHLDDNHIIYNRMDALKGIKKIVEILRKADNKHYTKSSTNREDENGNMFYCSLGMVAKELGYPFDGNRWARDITPYDFVRDKCGIDERVTKFITSSNDMRCDKYSCVADLLEKEYLK